VEVAPILASPSKITKSLVHALNVGQRGKALPMTPNLKAFLPFVLLLPARKSFILEKRIDGKVKWLTLGHSIPTHRGGSKKKKASS
jgi:hypothetical protein